MVTAMNHASINNTVIQAVLSGSFKFTNRQNAQDFLEKLRDKFILAKNSEEQINQGRVRLWIRGYKITPKEQEEGGLGNYCLLELHDLPDGTTTINATKEDVAVNLHPVRKRKNSRMPNYGHPTLRLAKKGTEFATYEQAAEILYNLHNEFPETTIPNKDRLDLMVYSRNKKEKGKPTTDKIRLVLKPKGNKFVLEIEQKAAVVTASKPKTPQIAEDALIKGKFTALALMKKKKK